MMHKKLLLSYLLIVLLNSTFLSENEDLENKCFDIFLKKRDENDYDFVKINVDDAENVSRKYGVMSIPTLIVFNNGQEVKKSVGFKSANELKDFLEF